MTDDKQTNEQDRELTQIDHALRVAEGKISDLRQDINALRVRSLDQADVLETMRGGVDEIQQLLRGLGATLQEAMDERTVTQTDSPFAHDEPYKRSDGDTET